jgi:hypothetical protein
VTRVRWLQAAWPYSMRTLAARLKQHTFQAESNDGFLVERVRDTFIEGRYVEKLLFQEVITDPFGYETTVDRLTYREVEFVFSSAYPHVELRKSPRSLQPFITRTAQATQFTTAFLAVNIDPFTWADNIRATLPQRFRIDLAQLADVFIEEHVTARIVLSSQQDIRATVARFTQRRKHRVERIQIKLEQDGELFSVQLAADGTLRTLDALPADVLNTIREALPQSSEQL